MQIKYTMSELKAENLYMKAGIISLNNTFRSNNQVQNIF